MMIPSTPLQYSPAPTVSDALVKDGVDAHKDEPVAVTRANFAIASMMGIVEVVSYVAIGTLLALATVLTFGQWKTVRNETKLMFSMTKTATKQTGLCMLGILSPAKTAKAWKAQQNQ